jgi:transcriptional regulator with XRE-family HTH domain
MGKRASILLEPEILSELGARVRSRRRKLGITGPELARIADCSVTQIYHAETAARGLSIALLYRVARALRVRPAYFLP